jgi:hypothetical protein
MRSHARSRKGSLAVVATTTGTGLAFAVRVASGLTGPVGAEDDLRRFEEAFPRRRCTKRRLESGRRDAHEDEEFDGGFFGLIAASALAFGACSTGTTGRGAEIVGCTAGLEVTIGCGSRGLGSCVGDPILTVCDGGSGPAIDCVNSSAPGFLGLNDDDTGRCPGVTVTCPASGQIAVRPSAFSGIPECNWQTRVGGI